nr:lantibiotic dehydratase [Bifidobacterium amazonense]
MKNDLFLEMIETSNFELYETILKYETLSPKAQKKVMHAVEHYLIRASMRPTPMGVFSALSFGQNTENMTGEYKKVVSIDAEWVSNLYKGLETKREVIPNLKINWNVSLKCSSDAYVNLFSNFWNSTGDEEILEYRKTKLLEIIRKITQTPIVGSILVDQLTIELGKSRTEILDYIILLLEKDVLVSNLRPKAYSASISSIIQTINSIKVNKDLIIGMKEIEELIGKYERIDLGKGRSLFERICNRMRQYAKSTNYLKIDLYKREDQKIDLKEKDQILLQHAINKLTYLTPKTPDLNCIRDYVQMYIKKYGLYREVPLLELLDPKTGLGSPYKGTYTNVDNPVNKNFDYLDNEIQKAIFLHQKEVDISDFPLEELPAEVKGSLSTDFDFVVVQLNDNKMMISPHTGSDRSGKMIGRFGLSNNLTVSKDVMRVELLALPRSSRLLNIYPKCSNCDFELPIGMRASGLKSVLDIHDIYVSLARVEDDYRFIFYSYKYNKYLEFQTNSMLNYKTEGILPYVGRFLLEATSHSRGASTPLFVSGALETLKKYVMIPRITYKRVIIRPQSWTIRLSYFNKERVTENDIKKFLTIWSMPKYIRIQDQDKWIIIDVSNIESQKEICHILNRDHEVLLYENLQERGTNAAELVLSAIGNNGTQAKKLCNLHYCDSVSTNDRQRKFVPNDSWVYIKLYMPRNDERNFLINNLFVFLKNNQSLFEKAFYIAYYDSEDHIRLRVLPKAADKDKLKNLIGCWAEKLFDENSISKYTYDTYDREIERYGGVRHFSQIEDIFSFDSMQVLGSLKNPYNDIQICKSLISFLKQLSINYNDLRPFGTEFKKEHYSSLFGQEYHLVRSEIIKYVNTDEDRDYPYTLRSIFQADNLSHQYFFDILQSLIHMHFNRYLVPKEYEVKYLYFTYNSLKESFYKEMNHAL